MVVEEPYEFKYYNIVVPQSTQWSPSSASSFTKALFDVMGNQGRMLGVRANVEQVNWYISDDLRNPVSSLQMLQDLVTAFYPNAEVREHNPSVERPYPFFRRAEAFGFSNDNSIYNAFTTVDMLRREDPLQLILQTANDLHENEYLTYCVVVSNMGTPTQQDIEEHLLMTAYDAGHRAEGGTPTDLPSLAGALLGRAWRNSKLKETMVARYSEAEQTELLKKMRQKLALVGCILEFDTPDKDRLDLFNATAAAIKNLNSPSGLQISDGVIKNFVIRNEEQDNERTAYQFLDEWKPEDTRILYAELTADEFATLWHLPHSDFSELKLKWTATVPTQVLCADRDLSKSYDANQPLQVAVGTLDDGTPICLNRGDKRYHSYITGQTGMGKSTLMQNLIQADIHSGLGVAVIDPHGTLINDILETSIAEGRSEDVVLLECANTNYPVPINPFRVPKGSSETAVFNTVLWIFKSIYAASWSATQMETVIRNMLQVVLSDPDATPLDMQEIVSNANYRRRVIKRLSDSGKLSRASKNFWNSFESQSPSEQERMTRPVLNRLTAFLGSPQIERMTCNPMALDFRELIQQKKIVLIDLSGDEIISEVNSMGAIFFANFFLASQSLGDIQGNDPPRFYLYVDETQRFITTALPAMFSEARKFGLSLTLANQYVGQLDEETRAGIANNVGTKFAFECSPDEARLTSKLYAPDVTQDQLQTLGMGRAAIRTRWDGETLPAFVAKTLPPPNETNSLSGMRDGIVKITQTELGFSSSGEIEKWLDTRYDSDIFRGSDDEDGTEVTDFA